MKISITALVFAMTLMSCAKTDNVYCQNNPKTKFKIIMTSDSHGVNSWPLTGGYDSIWFNKIGVRFRQFYDTVVMVNMADAGGRTIGSAMPTGYTYACGSCNSEPQYSIDTILKQNPDLIIISMSGNHTVNHMPADEAIRCYKRLIDTMRLLGKSFIIGGQAPRQKTFTSGMTLQSYYDSSIKINNFLISYAPKSYVDIYGNLEDTVFGKRPWPAALCADSLHFSDLGNTYYLNDYMNNYTVDSCLTDYKGRCANFTMDKVGSNIVISGIFKYRKVRVYVSNDYVNFILYKTYTSPNKYLSGLNVTIPDLGYLYYKVESMTGRLVNTITKKLN